MLTASKNPFRADFVKLQFPPNMTPMIAISGHQLEGDEDGVVEVPKALVATCKAHGLSDYSEPVKAPPAPKK